MEKELNRPFSSYKNPHFQIEAKCTTSLVETSFIWMRMKTHFHINGWALRFDTEAQRELGNGLLKTFRQMSTIIFSGVVIR